MSLVVACTGIPDAGQLAARHDLSLRQVPGGPFVLPVLARTEPVRGGRLHLYLEGDGRPWLGRERAANPTGRSTVALDLMLADPHPALLLGRPCYHQPGTPSPPCEPDLWTEGRYSPAVLDALAEAVQRLLAEYRPASLVLVGYSGGGVLALLLAQRQTLPTTEPRAAFRQVHLAGGRDRIVPPATTARYRERHPDAEYRLRADFDHHCCRVEAWPGLLDRVLAGGD